MKIKVYLRIAKTRRSPKVSASLSSNLTPLYQSLYRGRRKFFPTLTIPLELDIPDAAFSGSLQTLKLNLENIYQAANIKVENSEIEIEVKQ